MHTHRLGNSDLNITPIGFGAWALGGGDWQFGWGGQEDQDSVAAIHAALELGVNWIDTAAVYGLGHSEEVVARTLADWKGMVGRVLLYARRHSWRSPAPGSSPNRRRAKSLGGVQKKPWIASGGRRRLVHVSVAEVRRFFMALLGEPPVCSSPTCRVGPTGGATTKPRPSSSTTKLVTPLPICNRHTKQCGGAGS